MRIPTLAVTLAAAATVVAIPTAANAAVAVNDSVIAKFETVKSIDVLANDKLDSGNSGKTLTVTSGTPTAAHALVNCTSAGMCTYDPDADWVGTETFTYTVSDGTATAEGQVTVKTVNVSLITLSSTPANL